MNITIKAFYMFGHGYAQSKLAARRYWQTEVMKIQCFLSKQFYNYLLIKWADESVTFHLGY